MSDSPVFRKKVRKVKDIEMMKTDPDICVCNPLTENFTTFEILIQTNNPAFSLKKSSTRRRYNDFCWLRKILKKHHPMCTCPELPEKKKFAERFEIQFLVQRMKELEDWLQSIVCISLYLSDTALHLFLQSTLTCKEIDQYLDGKLSESQLIQAYKNAEHISTTSFEENLRRDPSGSAEGGCVSVGATGGQSSPVQIRANILNSNLQERSDSGIAGFESDGESSYDSQGSPYISSMDSAIIPEKYPPLTEVCSALSNLNTNKDSSGNAVCPIESGGKFENDSVSKQVETVEVHKGTEYQIETVTSDGMFEEDVEINVTCKKILSKIQPTLSNPCVNHIVMDQNSSEKSEKSKSVSENETTGKSKQVTHKVEMGVLFC